MVNNELYHHGVKGMRWGVRRTPAQLGHRTSSGRRKRSSSDAVSKAIAKLKKKRQASRIEKEKQKQLSKQAEKDNKLLKKSIDSMSDEELNRAINRARMEDTYRSLRPEKISAGKKFTQSLVSNVIAPSLQTAGKNYLTNVLNKAAENALKDKGGKSELEKLKDTYNLLKAKKDIEDLKNPKPDKPNWESELKRQQYEKNEKDRKVDDLQREINYKNKQREWDKLNKDNDDKPKSEAKDNTSKKDSEPKSEPKKETVTETTALATVHDTMAYYRGKEFADEFLRQNPQYR